MPFHVDQMFFERLTDKMLPEEVYHRFVSFMPRVASRSKIMSCLAQLVLGTIPLHFKVLLT